MSRIATFAWLIFYAGVAHLLMLSCGFVAGWLQGLFTSGPGEVPLSLQITPLVLMVILYGLIVVLAAPNLQRHFQLRAEWPIIVAGLSVPIAWLVTFFIFYYYTQWATGTRAEVEMVHGWADEAAHFLVPTWLPILIAYPLFLWNQRRPEKKVENLPGVTVL